MDIRARPSKTFFYRQFAKDMKHSAGKVWGTDVACAHFKNRGYFLTDHYIGIDIHHHMLRQSLKVLSLHNENEDRSPHIHSVGGDIRKPPVRSSTQEFVVSTHTLAHLQATERLAAIQALISLVCQDGNLILTMPLVDFDHMQMVDEQLNGSFSTVKKVRYCNRISNAYETLLSKADGSLTFENRGKFAYVLMSGIACTLALLESIPLLQNTGNQLYYFAQGKLT